jgi:hypothetical protein
MAKKAAPKKHVDKRTLWIRIVAGICAFLIIGSVFISVLN